MKAIINGEVVELSETEEGSLFPASPVEGLPSLALASISDRQFFQALASPPYRLITEAEAEEAVAMGTIPDVMQSVIDALPADQRFPVRMLVRGATTFERANPLVNVFGASQAMDAAAIDEFWRFASEL